MRVVICDPALSSIEGHHVNYNIALSEMFASSDFSVTILGNSSITEDVTNLLKKETPEITILPSFATSHYEGTHSNFLYVSKANKFLSSASKSILSYIDSSEPVDCNEQFFFVFHSCNSILASLISSLLESDIFLGRCLGIMITVMAPSLPEKVDTFTYSNGDRVTDTSDLQLQCEWDARWWPELSKKLAIIRSSLNISSFVLCENSRVSECLGHYGFSHRKLESFPDFKPKKLIWQARGSRYQRSNNSASHNMILSFLGSTALRKNSHLVPGLIANILSNVHINDSCQVSIHYQLCPENLKPYLQYSDYQIFINEYARLSSFQQATKVPSNLAPKSYYNYLSLASLIILPYGQDYAVQGSGVFWESLAIGIPAVVPEGSFMATYCVDNGLPCLQFKDLSQFSDSGFIRTLFDFWIYERVSLPLRRWYSCHEPRRLGILIKKTLKR